MIMFNVACATYTGPQYGSTCLRHQYAPHKIHDIYTASSSRSTTWPIHNHYLTYTWPHFTSRQMFDILVWIITTIIVHLGQICDMSCINAHTWHIHDLIVVTFPIRAHTMWHSILAVPVQIRDILCLLKNVRHIHDSLWFASNTWQSHYQCMLLVKCMAYMYAPQPCISN